MYDEVAALDPSIEIGVSEDVSAGVSHDELKPLLFDADGESWPCAASSACIVVGDSAPEPALFDLLEPGSDVSESDIVNGSAPLPKNPVDWVEDEEDEACEATDLTASHAAEAAPKAISMIKTPDAPLDCGPRFHDRFMSKRRAKVKYPEISSKFGIPRTKQRRRPGN